VAGEQVLGVPHPHVPGAGDPLDEPPADAVAEIPNRLGEQDEPRVPRVLAGPLGQRGPAGRVRAQAVRPGDRGAEVFGAERLAALLEPVGVHQPRGAVARRAADRGHERRLLRVRGARHGLRRCV
jgi:hypothetical protein